MSNLTTIGLYSEERFPGSRYRCDWRGCRASPAEARRLHDLLTMAVAAIAAFSSGALHHLVGWQTVTLAVIPMIVCVVAATLWLRATPTPAPAE